ncbi:acyl-CoA dehydrogenase family protein, partial [Streptomyces sp. TOR3209]
MTPVIESDAHKSLREAVSTFAAHHPRTLGTDTTHLWQAAAKLGYIGVNLPEAYGGGGAGITELSLVLEEMGAAGNPLLMMIVSPAICGTVIARFGTDEQ